MPDLNLIDEGGFDEAQAPAAPPAKRKSSGGGGGGKTMIIVVVVLIIAAAGVYFLNQRGIIKLWGKKAEPVAQLQEEAFPQDMTEQAAQEQVQKTDTTEVALLDTPPVEEKTEGAKESEKAVDPSAKKKKEESAVPESASKLNDMKGEFTIQVVAYREKKKAEETSKNLEFAGYPSFVERVPMKGGDWFTVRIGRYPSRVEAKKAVLTFGEQLQSHYVIDKIRVNEVFSNLLVCLGGGRAKVVLV
jgi:septal ring-binding cell division protein DamX